MKIRYTADVAGHVWRSDVEEFQIGRWKAILNFSEWNHEQFPTLLDSIALERELTNKEMENLFKSNRLKTPESPDGRGEISTGIPDEISSDANIKLQTIESFGGLHGINQLDWKYAEVELLPESDDEYYQLEVLGHNFERHRKTTPHHWQFDLDEFNWDLIEELRIPLSFFRRGCQLLDEGDYVNAYTNFYMVLEGMYADSHQNVEDQFLESEGLVSVAESAFPDVKEFLGEELAEYFEFYNKEKSPEGYLQLLVIIRHQLNHFFGKSSGSHNPNPLEVDRFEPLSNAIMHLTFLLLQMKINEIEFT